MSDIVENISVFQRQDGKWGAAVSLGKRPDGTRSRICRIGKTQDEAKLKLYNALAEQGKIEAPAVVVNDLSPVENLVLEFKQGYIFSDHVSTKKGTKIVPRSSRTNENYLSSLKYFEDFFKGYTVNQVTAHAVNEFFLKLIAENKDDGTPKFSQETLNKILYIVGVMFQRAAGEKRYISVNPLEDEAFQRPISRQEKREVPPYTKEEIRQLLEITKDTPRLYAPMVVLVTTGMRCEELLALKWADLDIENQVIHIRGALTTEVEFDTQGKKKQRKTILKGTKTAGSSRDVAMLKEARAALLEWKSFFEQERQRPIEMGEFAFQSSKGTHWTYSGFRSAIQRRIDKRLEGFGRFAAHRIRHYVGTSMAASNAGKFNIMVQLGHSRETTTLRYIGRSDQALVKANGNLLASGIQEALWGG